MSLTVKLETGHLRVETRDERMALDELCGFGSRNNPKRGFLFVSKVLGKHWPSCPERMHRVHATLAGLIATGLDTTLFVGMAETATGLAHGVFEEYLKRVPPGTAGFVQTTRYRLDGGQAIAFDEPHSHAVKQLLYVPEDAGTQAVFSGCRTVVLVDDEVSTGTTLRNLVIALHARTPTIHRVIVVCLTDFSEGKAQSAIAALPGISDVQIVSLASGRFMFEPDSQYEFRAAAPAERATTCRRHLMTAHTARLGSSRRMALSPRLIDQCRTRAGERTLIVGTGECMHPAFRIAHELSSSSARVRVQSTTRSPALVDADIGSALEVADPYGEGIPNFLYNFDRTMYDSVFVIHESPRNDEVRALCAALDAYSVCLQDDLVLAPGRSL